MVRGIILFYLIVLLFSSITVFSQINNTGVQANKIVSPDIYSNNVVSVTGTQYNFQNFKGEKICLIILPVTQGFNDSLLLIKIDSIALASKSKIQWIVIPSNEDGYDNGNNNTLIQWHQSLLDASIIISKPLFTHKSSGTVQQDKLFYWLTHSTMNAHFDSEVSGPGSIFLIDTKGALIGVFGPATIWNNQFLNMIFQ